MIMVTARCVDSKQLPLNHATRCTGPDTDVNTLNRLWRNGIHENRASTTNNAPAKQRWKHPPRRSKGDEGDPKPLHGPYPYVPFPRPLSTTKVL